MSAGLSNDVKEAISDKRALRGLYASKGACDSVPSLKSVCCSINMLEGHERPTRREVHHCTTPNVSVDRIENSLIRVGLAISIDRRKGTKCEWPRKCDDSSVPGDEQHYLETRAICLRHEYTTRLCSGGLGRPSRTAKVHLEIDKQLDAGARPSNFKLALQPGVAS